MGYFEIFWDLLPGNEKKQLLYFGDAINGSKIFKLKPVENRFLKLSKTVLRIKLKKWNSIWKLK